MEKGYDQKLLSFIEQHPSCYHVVEGQRLHLLKAGYEQLLESREWDIRPGGRYFVVRNGSSIIAFRVPTASFNGFMRMASHSDSPSLKIKEGPEITVDGKYKKLNVEMYGGSVLSSWLDRPLSVAGRIFLRTENGISMRIINIDRDLLLVPGLAIHMNRDINKGQEMKVQQNVLPLYGRADAESLTALIAGEEGIDPDAIVGHDLFAYSRQAPSIWGANREFMSSPRLDDLQCAFSSLMGFLESSDSASIPVHVVFDNEEIGSLTKQGAASGFLADTLRRIADGLGLSQSEYLRKLPQSFMLSGDNAHAMHPNYADKCDPVNHPMLGGGVVLKYSGSQKYTTDAASAAIVSLLAERAGIRLQVFTNHSDIPGGSTLGSISAQQLSIKSADVGIAQLAMHSAYETCGCGDTAQLVALARQLFSSTLTEQGEESYTLE